MSEEKKETSEKVDSPIRHEKKEETITIKKQDLWKYSTFLLAVVVVIQMFAIFGGSGEPTGAAVAVDNKPSPAPTPSAPPQQAAEVREFDPDRDHIRGDPDAPVKMIEYSDFECPFCGRLATQTLPALDSEIESGKVALVYRHFPLSFHPSAQKAAEASECAAEQDKDKFWEMHDKIFENQQSLSLSSLKKWAEDIGLNTNQFNTCLDSGKMATRVQEDFRDGQKAGVRGTPATFVNGQLISGAQPPQAFQQAIQAAA